MNNRLIQLADYLDSLGLHKEADYVDYMVVKSSDQDDWDLDEELGPRLKEKTEPRGFHDYRSQPIAVDEDPYDEDAELDKENKEWAYNECRQKVLRNFLARFGLKHLIGVGWEDIPEEDIEAYHRVEDKADRACNHIYRNEKGWHEWGKADSEPQQGDGRVDIEPGELHDLADMMDKKPGLFDNLKNVGQDIAYKIKSVMPKQIRGLLSGIGPRDPLRNHHEELKEAVTKYINKNYEVDGVIESIEWGWQDPADTYSYEVIVNRPWPDQDPDYREHWIVWIGKLDEYIYYGPTERIEGTNYHLAGEW